MDTKAKTTAKPVIVRTYSAGVHFGYLVSRNGKEVVLEKSRRLWRWFGAWTLNEIATAGLDQSKSKIAAPVSTITLTEAIEIIPATEAAIAKLALDFITSHQPGDFVVHMEHGIGHFKRCIRPAELLAGGLDLGLLGLRRLCPGLSTRQHQQAGRQGRRVVYRPAGPGASPGPPASTPDTSERPPATPGSYQRSSSAPFLL